MSLEIAQFQLAKERTTMRLGERLHVRLEVAWDPPSDGGSEEVRFYCRPDSYKVQPERMSVTVPDDGESVTVDFRVTVTGEASGLVEIYAEGSESLSMDSIRMRVEK